MANNFQAQALTEIFAPGPDFDEMHLLWPPLARLTQAASRVVTDRPALPTPARRFEAELLLQLDSLLGRAPLALDFYRPAQYFDARLELNYKVNYKNQLP